ncbi:MAG: hypothetical protein HYY42_00900 [Chloroflexi bacterium]|nr:hypothetical protein [Chloroflexota bacterium]MBI2982744.1 hypothetical protein [Chloroflexota bacterium]
MMQHVKHGPWSGIVTKAPERCVVNGCDDPHRGRGFCHKHYMTWDRDRKSGKVPRVTPLR